MWGIQSLRGVENCLPTRISGNSGIYWIHDAKEVPDTQLITYDYGDFMLTWELRSYARHNPPYGTREGLAFHASDASMVVDSTGWTVYPKGGGVGEVVKGPGILHDGLHERNFLDCIKSRKAPNADVEIGRLSTTLAHLGNICTRLGRDLRFDPKTETFGVDKAANAFLTKEYRDRYHLPKV
jgi:hypothetical protein